MELMLILMIGILICVPIITFASFHWSDWMDCIRKPSAGALAVRDLLEADPDGWVGDRFVITHARSGISIWIANEDYGVKWWVGTRGDSQRGAESRRRKDRRLVWRAVCRQQCHPNGELVRRARQAIAQAPIDVRVVKMDGSPV